MADVTTAEIQNRIAGLKAEVEKLTMQLACARSNDAMLDDAEQDLLPTDDQESSPVDRQHSLRTLRDLMWQGRWGLAFHLAKALEAQGVADIDFSAPTIRAWALASQGERRGPGETEALTEALLRDADLTENGALAPRLLEWAALISLLRGVDAARVRPLAARFVPPEELQATRKWWNQYVEALSSMMTPTAKWERRPEREMATEVNEFVLSSDQESVRLAASCLMMSIRGAVRHVQTPSMVEQRFILNAEISRTASLKFAEDGEVASQPDEVEQAVLELAGNTSAGRALMISAKPTGETKEAPTPRGMTALSRIAALEQSLASAVSGEIAESVSEEQPLQQIRQSTARARIESYAQQAEIRKAAPQLANARDQLAVVPATTGLTNVKSDPVVAVPAEPVPAPAPAAPVEAKRVETKHVELKKVEPASHIRREDRHRIHDAALATAFGGDDSQWGMNAAGARPIKGGSVWEMFFNPQAAIVAGLLMIGAAVVAGLGTGLVAKDMESVAAPAAEASGDAGTDLEGDLPVIE